MSLEVKLRRRDPAETKDTQGSMMVGLCAECTAALGKGWPLWGIHLTVAMTYHAAHWMIAEARDWPVLPPDAALFGQRIGIVTEPRP